MRRIQRDVCHDDLIKRLTSGDSAVFGEIWRLMLFAAAIGVHEGRRLPILKADSGKAMPESYFSTPGWKGFLYLIGIAESGDTKCLHGTDEAQELLVAAFEEYANQGLHSIARRLAVSISPLDEFIALLLEADAPLSAGPDVEDLI